MIPEGRLGFFRRRGPRTFGSTEVLRPPNPGFNLTGSWGYENLIRSRAHRWSPLMAQMAPRRARGMGLDGLVPMRIQQLSRVRAMGLGRVR